MNLSQYKAGCPYRRTVICYRANHADDKTPAANCLMTAAETVVSMLPKNTSIFLVNTDRILDHKWSPSMRNVCARLEEDE